jgi:hypothetical protein
MKQVFSSNSECIHIFAQRIQDAGRSASGSVYFEYDKLYSYGSHFVLAEFLPNDAVLINDTSYSNSTSKHQNIAFSALRQYRRIYVSSHNLQNVLNSLSELQKLLLKARKPEKYVKEALELIEKHKEAQKIYSTYKGINKQLEQYEEFFNISLDGLKPLIEKRRKQEAIKQIKAQKEFEQAFFAYEPYNSLRYKASSKIDLVRVSQCGKFLETSQNVRVPINDAKLLLLALKAGKNIIGEKIEWYTINSVSEKHVKIGCHTLSIAQIESQLI